MKYHKNIRKLTIKEVLRRLDDIERSLSISYLFTIVALCVSVSLAVTALALYFPNLVMSAYVMWIVTAAVIGIFIGMSIGYLIKKLK